MDEKKPVPRQLAPYVFKHGHPGGRPKAEDRSKTQVTRRLTKAMAALLEMECPDAWMRGGLETYAFQKLNVGEVIALRAAACAASGVRYNNVGLLETLLSRTEGKVPLRVIHKAEETGGDDEFEGMTVVEIDAKIEEIMSGLREDRTCVLNAPGCVPQDPQPDATGVSGETPVQPEMVESTAPDTAS